MARTLVCVSPHSNHLQPLVCSIKMNITLKTQEEWIMLFYKQVVYISGRLQFCFITPTTHEDDTWPIPVHEDTVKGLQRNNQDKKVRYYCGGMSNTQSNILLWSVTMVVILPSLFEGKDGRRRLLDTEGSQTLCRNLFSRFLTCQLELFFRES